jgi:hypothetical protein
VFLKRYDGVPFSNLDFHQPYCEIQNYGNADEVPSIIIPHSHLFNRK